MRIYLVDDEEIIMKGELETVCGCCPDDEVTGFTKGMDLLEKAKTEPCDIAFLDINLGDCSGVELAEKLKSMYPNVNIIFLTAYDNYFREAMQIRASGYLLKPISRQDIINEMNNLRYGVKHEKKTKLQVICLGNFDVKLPDGTPVRFERSKAKEALAYLVHLRGSSCSIRELAAVLFEDEPFDHKNQMYIQKIISSLMKNLREAGAEEVVEKNFNSLAVNTALIDCDYYHLIEENKSERFKRPEEYMEQYSWAMY